MLNLATSSREHRPRIRAFGLGLLAVVMLAILAMNSVACVRTGHVGVVTLFGRVTGTTMSEGIHPVNPLARVHELDIKTQEVKERAVVPSKEGLIMGLEASVLYHLDPARAAEVYQRVGTDIPRRPAGAELPLGDSRGDGRQPRRARSTPTPAKPSRSRFWRTCRHRCSRAASSSRTSCCATCSCPIRLKQAIEAKQQAQQEAQRMEFVLQRERQEAERKRVEAQGIKDFQNIVTEGISDKLLEWKGIEATIELARSQNAKVVVVGNTKTGLPLIFSGDK